MLPDLTSLSDRSTLFLILGGLLVLGLLARRVPVLGKLLSLFRWAMLALLLLVAIDQRDRLAPYLGQFAATLDQDRQQVVGEELRIPMARDGHFWVRAKIAGVERRLMVDSGATVTALSTDAAAAMHLQPRAELVPVLLRTANGTVRAETATVPELRIGNIVARDLTVVVSPAFGEVNVLGMNFLSRLRSWRVEGRTLIMQPHHPQPVADEQDA